ncbi:MAG TPA: T9SS type A sorting domain-containing protein [Ignavibacteriaceae bacterium]|nr:T9SS type A sorting domain-containing protein [Ignavibacteriaceae bacterium]
MKKLVISAAGLIFCFSAVSFSQTGPKETRIGNVVFRNHKINTGMQVLQKETGLFSEDTLRKLKEDFLVNTLEGDYGAEQYGASIAADSSGNYALTWLDYRTGKREIYAQFYNSRNEKIGNNFKVNEDAIEGNNSPFIAANKKGDFVITWLKNFSQVMAQRFTNDAHKAGGNIEVNTTWGMNTMEPCVAVNENGSFLVMWASEQGDWDFKVYARLFENAGLPLTPEIYVSEPAMGPSSIGQGKHIAVDKTGNFCITWSSYGQGQFSEIYLQILNSSGEMTGSNTLVSITNDSSDCWFPEISSTDDGHFLIIWGKQPRNFIADGIDARIYSGSNFITGEMVISGADYFSDEYSISSDKDNTFLILYYGKNSPCFQKMSTSGQIIGKSVDVKYNSDIKLYSFLGPMTDIYHDCFYLASSNYEKADPNIYLQQYKSDLTPINPLLKANDDLYSSYQIKPLVHFNNEGISIVLWEDRRNGRADLFCQVYDKDFNPVGSNIQVNDIPAEGWHLIDKDVQCLSDGTFVIGFTGSETYDYGNVYLQRISPAAEKIGANTLVSENYSEYDLKLNINNQDQILVCWYGYYEAAARKYNKNLTPLAEEKVISSTLSNCHPFALSIDQDFKILTVWLNYNSSTYEYENNIYGRYYNENGTALTDKFTVESNVSGSAIYSLNCKTDKDKYVVVWSDYNRFYVKRFYTEYESVFLNSFYAYNYNRAAQADIVKFENQKLLVTMNSDFDLNAYYLNDNKQTISWYKLHQYDFIIPFYDGYNANNSVDLFNGRLLLAYESNELQTTGYDIWANVQYSDLINFKKESIFHPSNYDVLYTNYPNPFNSTTKIPYQIFAFHKVRLSVFDILGREVKVLVDQYQEKGVYEIDFDASDLPSGIYFYRLQAFDTAVRKMIHIK